MCKAFYLGSDIELPVSNWDKNCPQFYTIKINSNNLFKDQFTKKYIYYLGSQEGCGCGFFYDDNDIDDREELNENEESKKNVIKMIDFINNALKNTNELELFMCWEGDENKKPVQIKTIYPEQILGTELCLEDLIIYRLVKKEAITH